MINNIISCEFNIDTACVEVKLTDGSMVSIDCIAVENEYANNMYETSELDYLIYNELMSYVRLLLSGKMEEYLRNNTDYTQTNMQFLRMTDFREDLIINVYYRKEVYKGNIKLFLDMLKTSTARP